jgi:hypothetical protein
VGVEVEVEVGVEVVGMGVVASTVGVGVSPVPEEVGDTVGVMVGDGVPGDDVRGGSGVGKGESGKVAVGDGVSEALASMT